MPRHPSFTTRSLFLTVIITAAAVLVACGSSGSPADGAAGGTGAGPARVNMSTEPNPPRANQDARFRIGVMDGNGGAVSGAAVKVTAKHTEMAHGSLSANAADGGNGQYAATIKPSMPGKWKVTVTVQAGGATKNVDFDVDVQ